VNELRDEGLPLLDTLLPSSVAMRESHEQSRPLVFMDPSHKLTQAFQALYDELETRRPR
jgi:chromosome partitioning protein